MRMRGKKASHLVMLYKMFGRHWLEILARHWPTVILAFLVGLLLILPALAGKWRWGVDFDHPANIRIDDEFLYLARIREVVDGHPLIGNAYLWEHKTKPPSPLFLGEWLLAQPVKLFGGKVVAGSIAYDFILPPISVLLTYFFLHLVLRRWWLAFLATVFLFFGLFPGDFARALSPQLNFIFWLAQAILFFLLFGKEESFSRPKKLLAAAAALNFGLLFYLYPYYWTFYLAFLAVFALWLFYQGRGAEIKVMAAIVAGGLLLALPYSWLMWRAASLSEYTATLLRISMIYSHFPSGIKIVVPALILLGLGVWLMRKGVVATSRPAAFLASGIIAAVISVNQHVVTGRNFEFSSHYDMLSFFWFVFFGAFLILETLESSWAWRRLVAGGAVALSLVPVAVNLSELASLVKPWPGIANSARFLPAIDWVRTNVAKDEVVYASADLAEYIPIYTSANVYFARPMRIFFMPDEEVMARFIISNYFAEFDREFVVENFRVIYGNQFINAALHNAQENKVRAALGLKAKIRDPYPAEDIRRVLERHGELRAAGFESQLKKYRADYIIWEEGDKARLEFDKLPFLEKIDGVGEFIIYKVH